MLVDGTSLGLGVLLERLNDSTAAVGNVGNVKVNTKVTPKAKANGTRPKDQVNVDSGILQKKRGLQEWHSIFLLGKTRGVCDQQNYQESKTVDPEFVT